MNKKGGARLTIEEMWGLIRAGVIALFVLGISYGYYFLFVGHAYAASKETLVRFQDALGFLEEGESRIVNLDLEKGVWLFGFNRDYNYIRYRKTDIIRLCNRCSVTLSKQYECYGKACLCLCTDECKKTVECKNFEDVEFFVVTDIHQDFNGGLSYEYGEQEGIYLAMPGKGVMQVEVSREDDVIYIGSSSAEKGQAREEFERLLSFTKNIGERRLGTCKLAFNVDTSKLTRSYFIVVYENGDVKLFSRQDHQTTIIHKGKISAIPFVYEWKQSIDETFENYEDLEKINFIIDPGRGEIPEDIEYGYIATRATLFLIQRDGKWLWTDFLVYPPNDCEQ